MSEDENEPADNGPEDPIDAARAVKDPIDILPSHGFTVWREEKVPQSLYLSGQAEKDAVRVIVIQSHPKYISEGIELECDYHPGDELMTFGPIPAQRHDEQRKDHRISHTSSFAGKVVRVLAKGSLN